MLKKILSGSIFVLLGNFIARGIIFVFNIIVARLLDIESYGQYSIIKSTISTVVNIINSSVNISITKSVAEKKDDKCINFIYSIFLVNFILSLITMSVIYFSKNYLIETYLLAQENLYLAFNVSLIYLFFSSLGTMIQAAMLGFERFKDIAISNLFASLIFLPFASTLVYYYHFIGTIYSLILFFMLYSTFQYLRLKSEFKDYHKAININKIWLNLKSISSFSVPLIVSSIIILTLFWYSRILLVAESNNFKEVATFDAAYQLISIIMIITGAVTSVVLPMLSSIEVKNNSKVMLKILKITLSLNMLFSVVVSIIIMLSANFIMSLYGSKFVAGAKVLEVIIFVSVFFSSSSVLNKYMIANNLNYSTLFIVCLSALIFYIAMLNFIPLYGAIGLSYAMIIYYFVLTVLYSLYIWLNLKRQKI